MNGFFILKRFKYFLETWKPIPLCWWFERRGLPIPKYFIGGAATAPSVTTNAATDISFHSAQLNGNVTSTGGSTTGWERGFVWSLTSVNSTPTIAGTGVSQWIDPSAGTTGAYDHTPTNLATDSDYSFRAYAINNKGTSYGSVLTFKTLPNTSNFLMFFR